MSPYPVEKKKRLLDSMERKVHVHSYLRTHMETRCVTDERGVSCSQPFPVTMVERAARYAGVAMGLVAKAIPFHNQTNRVVYLFWASDKNSQQTHKSSVNMNAGVDGAGFGYARERERKDVHTGELMINPGDSCTIEMPTSKIFVTISSEAGSYTTMPPCIFIDRMFSAQNCKLYTIREHKFASHGIGLPPPMPGYGGNAVPRGMHPQIMGGQQQAPTMFPGQDYGMGGQQQVQRRMEPRPGPMQTMFPGQDIGIGGQQQAGGMHPHIMGGQQHAPTMFRGQDHGMGGQQQAHGMGGQQQAGGMHPQIMGGQQQAPTMFRGQDYGMGGQQQAQRRMEPRPGPVQKMFPGQAAGSGIGQQQLVQPMPRGQNHGIGGHQQVGGMHPHQVRMQKGICVVCGIPVFNDQARGRTPEGSYVHAACDRGQTICQ